jgi:sarcosine oxidase
MGAAAAWNLARRGRRVAGFDRLQPPHALGSTHGRTRIIRQAYFEDPLYVPFLRRAAELWSSLEQEAGERLFLPTGGLMIGPPGGALLTGAAESAAQHGIPHEMLDGLEVHRRHPAYQPRDGHLALFDPGAGVLLPERIILSLLARARDAGADLRTGTAVSGWDQGEGGVVVHTDIGRLEAGSLIVAAGPWMPGLLGDLDLPLGVERQLAHWFEPTAHHEVHGPDQCPIALAEEDGGRLFATFPDLGDGVKMGVHHEGEPATPDGVVRVISDGETADRRETLRRLMPDAAGPLRDAIVCLYTNTPDHRFILDRHPRMNRVVIASACSGHGFKFASVIGEVLADLACDTDPAFDITPFALARSSLR